MKRLFLQPGEVAVTNEPMELVTILGSCVAVALFDRKKQVGGLNHFLLPNSASTEPSSERYGGYALPLMLSEVLKIGGSRAGLAAKVYGGANVIAQLTCGANIGQDNILCALTFLSRERIPILGQDIGGKAGRKITFNTETWEVKVTYIDKSLNDH